MLIYFAILLFAIAALFGVYLLTFILQDKHTPKGVAFVHGPFAVLGLLLLIVYAIIYSPKPIISILIFILAALGGLTLIFRDITGKSIPKWLAIGHGSIAIFGFLFLLFFAFSP